MGGSGGGWGAATGGPEPAGAQRASSGLGVPPADTLTSAGRGEWARFQNLVPGLRPDRASGLLQVNNRVKTRVCGFLLSPTHLPARDLSLAPGWVPEVSVWRGVC